MNLMNKLKVSFHYCTDKTVFSLTQVKKNIFVEHAHYYGTSIIFWIKRRWIQLHGVLRFLRARGGFPATCKIRHGWPFFGEESMQRQHAHMTCSLYHHHGGHL